MQKFTFTINVFSQKYHIDPTGYPSVSKDNQNSYQTKGQVIATVGIFKGVASDFNPNNYSFGRFREMSG